MSAEHRQERLEQQSGRTIAGRVFLADGDKGVLLHRGYPIAIAQLGPQQGAAGGASPYRQPSRASMLHVHSDSLENTKHSTWALPLIQHD